MKYLGPSATYVQNLELCNVGRVANHESLHQGGVSVDTDQNENLSTEITMGSYNYHIPRATNSDPFSSTPVPLDGRILQFLTYIRSVTIFVSWSVEMTTKSGQRYLTAAFQAKSKDYFASEMVMHSHLVFALSFMASIHPPDGDRLRQECSKHYGQAVKLLRHDVQNSDLTADQLTSTFYAVNCLTIADFKRAGYRASTTHRQALKQIIHLMGGFDNLHWMFKEGTILFFTSISSFYQQRCELEICSFDPGPFRIEHEPSSRVYQSLMRLPTPQTACPENIRSPGMSVIFAYFRELIPIEALKRQHGISEADYSTYMQLFRWSHLRRMALSALMSNHWYEIAVKSKAVDEPANENWFIQGPIHQVTLEMCLCLASRLSLYLIFMRSEVLRYQGRSGFRFFHILLQRCVKRLELDVRDIDLTDLTRNDILWILAIGAQVEHETAKLQHLRGGSGSDEEEDGQIRQLRWFSTQFCILAKRMEYFSIHHLAILFESTYIYDAITQEQVLDRLLRNEIE